MTGPEKRTTTPSFVKPLLGYRLDRGGNPTEFPNISDASSTGSVAMSRHAYDALGIPRDRCVLETDDESGAALEETLRGWLGHRLPELETGRDWLVDCKSISAFAQYEHLDRLRRLVEQDLTGLLKVEVGTDYLVKPDCTVSLPGMAGGRQLHAAVSCKWTLRSDRAQNVRHEAVMLIRHRRGRLPHIAAVTMEPMASRVAALARGTGEIDAVYHPMFDEFVAATYAVGPPKQRQVLDELLEQQRLHPLNALAETLVRY